MFAATWRRSLKIQFLQDSMDDNRCHRSGFYIWIGNARGRNKKYLDDHFDDGYHAHLHMMNVAKNGSFLSNCLHTLEQ